MTDSASDDPSRGASTAGVHPAAETIAREERRDAIPEEAQEERGVVQRAQPEGFKRRAQRPRLRHLVRRQHGGGDPQQIVCGEEHLLKQLAGFLDALGVG